MRDQNTIEKARSCLVKTILQAAEKNISKNFPEMKKIPPIALWNKECEREEIIVRAKYRKHRRDPKNTTKLRSFQYRRVIKQRVFRKARKDTWNKR